MNERSSILLKKLAYEQFSRDAIRSKYISELPKNNRSLRHVLRFVGNIFMSSGLLYFVHFCFMKSAILGIAAFPIYLFFQGLLVSGFMIHSHELSHNHIRIRWLNDLIGIVSGLVSFVNFYSFKNAHKYHHRNIGSLDTPEVGSPISPSGQSQILHDDKLNKTMIEIFARSRLAWFLTVWPLFLYYGDYNSWILPFKVKGRYDAKSVAVSGAFALINIVLVALFPLEYLSLYLLPVLLGGNRILALTSMHHAHEDSVFFNHEHHNFYNTIMSTTDRDFGRIVNFFMMNNGYHIPHHLNPHIAYYDLKKASAYLRQSMPDELTYNFYPNTSFYAEFFASFYDQRLDQDHEFYQLKVLTADKFNVRLQQQRAQA